VPNAERSRSKRLVVALAFASLLVLATIAALELGALALFHFRPDRFPPREAIVRSLSQGESETVDPVERSGSRVLHPYVGYVRNAEPGRETVVNRLRVEEPINADGFIGMSSLAPKGDDVVRIALTGGSVAEELYLYGRDTIASELAASGAFDDARFEFVSLAIAGFKQPQQLLALSYLLVRGALIDIVINLDGFNEVVLPFTDNVPLKLAPSYPFRWRTVAADGIDPGAAILVARITESEQRLNHWRRLLDRFPLRNSAFVLAGWQLLRERSEVSVAALQFDLRERLGKTASSQSGGPVFDPDDVTGATPANALFVHSAAIWRRSSEAIASLCESRGIAYFHFLQPNLYYHSEPRSAPSASDPRQNATRLAAETGYPLLVEQGARLRADGIRFVDLTGVFAGRTEPIYRDNCCHFFANGYEIVGRAVAAAVAAATLDPEPPAAGRADR